MKKRLTVVLIFVIILLSFVNFVFAEKVEVRAQIHKGWNLLYGFVDPEQLEAGAFEPKNIKVIYAFIPITQKYARVYPRIQHEKLSVMSREQLMSNSFWVYSTKTAEGSLNEVEHATEYWIEEPIPIENKQMFAGWNFAGVTLEMVCEQQSEACTLKGIAGTCNIQEAYSWDSEKQNWVDIINETLGQDWAGRGIAIKVQSNCNLGFPKQKVNCTDSDGGLGYFERGVVRTLNGTMDDYCVGDTLMEWVCEGAGAKSTTYACPLGCGYGRCMQEGECILFETYKKTCRFKGIDYKIEILGGGCGDIPVEMEVSYKKEQNVTTERLRLAQSEEKSLKNNLTLRLIGSPCALDLVYIQFNEE